MLIKSIKKTFRHSLWLNYLSLINDNPSYLELDHYTMRKSTSQCRKQREDWLYSKTAITPSYGVPFCLLMAQIKFSDIVNCLKQTVLGEMHCLPKENSQKYMQLLFLFQIIKCEK